MSHGLHELRSGDEMSTSQGRNKAKQNMILPKTGGSTISPDQKEKDKRKQF